MTTDECKMILATMVIAYPSYKPADEVKTIKLWSKMLADYSFEVVTLALQRFITTDATGYAPTIGQIIDQISKISESNDDMTESEAWSLVYKALCNSGYHAKEEFNKLPPEIQRAVGSADQLRIWAMDEEFNEGVIASNFKRNYQTILLRKREEAKIPPRLRSAIGTMIENSSVLSLKGEQT